MLTLHARNFYALRRLAWPLREISILTGANGAGKTTALLALKVLRTAFDRGLPEAVSLSLGGSYNLRNHDGAEEEPIELGLDLDDLSWRVRLTPRGATVGVMDERLTKGSETIFLQDSAGNFSYRGQRQDVAAAAAERLGLRLAVEAHPEDQEAERMAAQVRHIQVFYDPDIRGLREGGSRATEDRHLHTSGRNVLTILRKWRDRREDAKRFDFVHQGLKAAFPGVYDGLDFDTVQTTISARVYRPGDETPNPITNEANGLIAMLLLLTEVAATPPGGLVAIDEPESSLHPYAIRRFIRLSRAWARQHDLTILLATHSPVLLDEFNGEPDRIFVLERGHETLPVRLDELRDREWLASYTLGELYTGGEFAANESS